MMNNDTETSSRFPNWGNIAIVLGVALLYFIAARLSLHLAFKNTNASPVWPPSGIAFAAILLLGKRIWPGILLGAFAANVVVFTVNQAAGFDDIIMMSAAIAVGNTLEALVGYRLIAIAKIDPLLSRTRDVFRFVVIAVGMCLLSCTIGVTALAFGRVAPWSAYSTIWFTWWLGDVVGVIILTPLILYWRRQWPQSWDNKIVVNEALVFSGIFVVTQMTFAGWFHIPLFTSQAYLLLPVLLWVVFSRSQLTAATSVALMSALAIMGTLDGMGPFFRPSMNESLLSLQAFVAVITLTMMALSAALLERNAAERALKTANLNLEARVIERTTELAVSNQRLETSNIELAKNNRDLDAFAYIASHDLKSPLRGINQLATWITEDLGENLSADTKNHLQLMLSRIARMEMLLDDLLAYSRVGRSGQELILVDTSRLIDEAFDLLSPSRSFALLVGPDMPTFTTSRTPLELIFRNLIANAIKHHDRVDGTININVDALPDAFAFTVSDDGPGIPPEHQERVFGMFQTLRSRDEGSGMGLAMVRKAVECVGGTISLTSDGKRGTAFRFTWPMDIGLTQIGSNAGGELP